MASFMRQKRRAKTLVFARKKREFFLASCGKGTTSKRWEKLARKSARPGTRLKRGDHRHLDSNKLRVIRDE